MGILNPGKISPEKAIFIFQKTYPDLMIVSVKDYGTDYLITAYKSPNETDPFYLMEKSGGFIRRYSIAIDPDRYYKTPVIYSADGLD